MKELAVKKAWNPMSLVGATYMTNMAKPFPKVNLMVAPIAAKTPFVVAATKSNRQKVTEDKTTRQKEAAETMRDAKKQKAAQEPLKSRKKKQQILDTEDEEEVAPVAAPIHQSSQTVPMYDPPPITRIQTKET